MGAGREARKGEGLRRVMRRLLDVMGMFDNLNMVIVFDICNMRQNLSKCILSICAIYYMSITLQ